MNNVVNIFTVEDMCRIILSVKPTRFFDRNIRTWSYYYNLACSFDLEVSSFKLNEYGDRVKGQKITIEEPVSLYGLPYAWAFDLIKDGIHYTMIGRKIQELGEFFKKLQIYLKLSEKLRINIYAHNLSYDFEFIKNYIDIDYKKVFATDTYKPLNVSANGGINFRCSLRLTNQSLADSAKTVGSPPKLEDFDYEKLRHHESILSEDEILYLKRDVHIVTNIIEYHSKINDDLIHKIPMTLTGYPRTELLKIVNYKTHEEMEGVLPQKQKLAIKSAIHGYREKNILNSKLDIELYSSYKQGFSGGFTHSNIHNTARTLYNVASYDISSAYAAAMMLGYYPVGNGVVNKNILTFEQMDTKNKCYWLTVSFFKLSKKPNAPDSIQSLTKALECKEISKHSQSRIENGRIAKARHATFTINELDLDSILKFYNFESYEILSIREYEKMALPYEIRKIVLKFFREKTLLKGHPLRMADYNQAKAILNAIYGMMVQGNVYDVITLMENNDWDKEDSGFTLAEQLKKYNDSLNRTTSFAWGIWITSHVRKTIHDIILKIGVDDYVYADTDSVKFLNPEKHKHIFENFNKDIKSLVFDVDHFALNTKGEKVYMGTFVYEETYIMFKTLGAKRYVYLKLDKEGDEVFESTVSGMSKKNMSKYLSSKEESFDEFNFDLKLSPEESGNTTLFSSDDFNTSDYDTNDVKFKLTDDDGVTCQSPIEQRGGWHFEKTSFNFLSEDDQIREGDLRFQQLNVLREYVKWIETKIANGATRDAAREEVRDEYRLLFAG